MSRGADRYLASANFTRPSDTTAYASGDLVANNTTAGSVTMMTFTFSSSSKPIWLRRVKITKSDPDIVSASFRLWLHSDSAVTFSNGDNGVLSIASSTLAVGSIFLPLDISFDYSLTGAGDVALATFDRGLHLLDATTYGFLEARAAYTPASAEVFTVELTGNSYY